MWSQNSAFDSEYPLQLTWDSTSYKLLKECPYKYALVMVEGWASRKRSIHLTFGIAFHAAMERYHVLRSQGIEQEEALEIIIAGMYYRQLRTQKEKELGGGYNEYAIPDGNTAKSSVTLLRTIVWYIDQYGDNDAAKTFTLSNGKPAVELSFRIPLDNGYEYAGHFDRVAEYNDQLWIPDYKTTTSVLDARYFSQWTPDIQMTGYTLAGQIVFELPVKGIIVDAVQLGVTYSNFGRQTINRTPGQLEEFLADMRTDLQIAQMFAEKQSWPMNATACHHFGGCEFRKVCSHSPAVRDNFLKADFVKRIWNPKEER